MLDDVRWFSLTIHLSAVLVLKAGNSQPFSWDSELKKRLALFVQFEESW